MQLKIRNQDRYSDATFWEPAKYTRLGTLENIPIYQIGEEADQPIVARVPSDDPTNSSPLFAIPLWELVNHSQAPFLPSETSPS